MIFIGSDLVLSSQQWSSMIVGACSTWINLDHQNIQKRDHDQHQFYSELAHASHLNLPAVLLPSPLLSDDCIHYARFLQKLIQEGAIHCWLPLPITKSSVNNNNTFSDKSSTILHSTSMNTSPADDGLNYTLTGQKRRRSIEERVPNENLSSINTNNSNSSSASPRKPLPTSSDAEITSSITNITSSSSLSLPYINQNDPWLVWNKIRFLCDSSNHLSLCLLINETTPVPTTEEITRWLSEPVKCVLLSCNLFTYHEDTMFINTATVKFKNIEYEKIFQKFYRFGMQFVLQSSTTNNITNYSKLLPYLQYLRKLADISIQHNHSTFSNYNDYLQIPLQPLADHLSNTTYEVFESDQPKYIYYQLAIEKALSRFINSTLYHNRKHEISKTGSISSPCIILMVVGAGRGPLVNCALQAAMKTNCYMDIKLYAVEKNPHAICTLRSLNSTNKLWKDKVTIIEEDMRTWNPPNNDRADILISELLGSFSDNELSPECLDGAQRLLNSTSGISIPYQYTSYLAPVMSQKLWNNINNLNDKKYYETPFVVRMHNHTVLQEPQPVFTFTHPYEYPNKIDTESDNNKNQPDNRRYKKLRFQFSNYGIIHGLGGYFDTILIPSTLDKVKYNQNISADTNISSVNDSTNSIDNEVKLSILPSTHTPNMESWFPMFFPLRNSITIQPNDYIDVHMWRCVEAVGSLSKGGGVSSLAGKRVWYEYAITTSSNVVTPIHNSAGKYFSIGL